MVEEKNKTDYLSRMSHELCTPMNAIVNMAHIAEATDDPVKIKACISSISGSISHLLGMINDIIDMSRIEFGQITLVNLPFEFERMLVKACDTVRQIADEKKIEISFNIEEGAPTKLRGDELRFSQIIINLLKCIIRFTPYTGKIKINVKETEQASGKAIFLISIISTGVDRRKENQAQLISTLEQLKGGENKHYGETSLSLTIAKALVEMMNGSIWAEDMKAGGTALNFTVALNLLETGKKPGAMPKETVAVSAAERGVGAGGEIIDKGYEEFLPYINVAEGLSNISGNKKLYTAMLKRFKDGVVFLDLKKSIAANDSIKIKRDYSALRKVAQSLSLTSLCKVLTLYESQIEISFTQKSILLEIEESLLQTNKIIDELLNKWDRRD